jgi:hypothetical protein
VLSYDDMTAHLNVLDASSLTEREEWLALWRRWGGAEPFAHPLYLEDFRAEGEQVLCATLTQGDHLVLYPFILRPLARLAFARRDEDRFDLTGPYGYGGAFSSSPSPELAHLFWGQFAEWCRAHRVVASFVRLSLFPEQVLPFDGDIVKVAENVVRSLDTSEDECWRDYDRKVRKNVRRALDSGLTCLEDPAGTRLDDFLRVYEETMRRRDALAGYLFPRAFYERLLADCRENVCFFHGLHEGRVVATELVLVSARFVYSFLGGTLDEYFPMRANDLLKHEIIRWARRAGKTGFVLGGGYAAGDGIFRYKKSFAPGGVVAFQVGRAIHDPGSYAELVEQRRAFEHAAGREWKPKPGFFPDYRA